MVLGDVYYIQVVNNNEDYHKYYGS